MVVKVGHTNYEVWAFDIESHNDAISKELKETSIWLYSFINSESKVEDEINYGTTMHQFLERVYSLVGRKRKAKDSPCRNLLIYVFNLSFEYSFLFPVLLAHGFKWKNDIDENDEYVFNAVTTKTASSVWSIHLRFGKDDGDVIFKDLRKVFVGSLESIAHSFGLETQKGKIVYEKQRKWLLKAYEPTWEEKVYNFKDTRILIEICERMKDDKDFWNSSSCGSYSMRKLIKSCYGRYLKPMKAFRRDNQYPILDADEDAFVRKATEGGICYVCEGYQFAEINRPIIHIDRHQMHPSSAYYNPFPYGRGEYYKGEPPKGRICCCHIRVSYSFVRLYSNIRLIGLHEAYKEEIWVWSPELATMRKCYEDLEVEFIDGYAYKFRFLPWRNFYKANYDKRLIAKKEHDLFNINQMKLLNNSSYGKMIEKPHNAYLEQFLTEDGLIDYTETPREVMKLGGKYSYVPVGGLIPAYSRISLIETALKFGWKNIVYFDTDSIFAIDNEETREALSHIDLEDHLGGWGLEQPLDSVVQSQFTAPKRYKLLVKDGKKEKAIVHMAGVNFDKPDYNMNITTEFYGVQFAVRVKGGTIIYRKKKKIDVQDKYKVAYVKNNGKII